MKILYVVSNQDLSGYHGGTVHVLAVSRELLKYGYQVHLVCLESASRVPAIPQSAAIHSLKRRHRFLLWRAGPEIQKLLDEIKPDVVMERYYNFAGEAILRANAAALPTILEVNSPMIEHRGSWKSRADLLLLGLLKHRRNKIAGAASLILSPLTQMIDPQFHNKVRETEWGAEPGLFDPALFPDRERLRAEKNFSTEDILFLHFGSLRKWHGLVTLLEAFDAARKQISKPSRMIIIGPSAGMTREQVSFVGTVPHPELPSWLKMCDIAVLPFSLEQHRYLELGFFWSPLKVFETMSMELPLITLSHPRLISILGMEEPIFFYDGTQQALANRMVEMAGQIEQCRMKARQFRQRVLEHYSWQAHVAKLNGWIKELAKQP